MFVQATKNEKLKNEIQRCADRNKMNLKVIEKVDNNMRKELQRSNPFKSEKCGRTTCKIYICELESLNFVTCPDTSQWSSKCMMCLITLEFLGMC